MDHEIVELQAKIEAKFLQLADAEPRIRAKWKAALTRAERLLRAAARRAREARAP